MITSIGFLLQVNGSKCDTAETIVCDVNIFGKLNRDVWREQIPGFTTIQMNTKRKE
jgi:hypothetical protein